MWLQGMEIVLPGLGVFILKSAFFFLINNINVVNDNCCSLFNLLMLYISL